MVYLDGNLVNTALGREVSLNHGSIISLHGPEGFTYEVVVSHNDKGLDDAAARENSSPKSGKAIHLLRKRRNHLQKENNRCTTSSYANKYTD